MDEVIAKILSSPSLTLPEDALKDFRRVLQSMSSFSVDEFWHVCNFFFKTHSSSPLNKKGHLKQCRYFISEWVKIVQLIAELNKKIEAIWSRTHPDSFGGDDFIPIILRLMPKDKTILTLLSRKLNECPLMLMSGSTAYILTNLLGAANYKLESDQLTKSSSCPSLHKTKQTTLNVKNRGSAPNLSLLFSQKNRTATFNNQHQADKHDHQANAIANDLPLIEKFTHLRNACTSYKTHLEVEIYNKLSTENPCIYSKYAPMKKNDVLACVTTELRDNSLISNALNCLIGKYICVQDFDFTLSLTDRSLLNILRLFKEKFVHHNLALTETPNKFNVSLMSLHSYYMLIKYTVDYTVDLLPIDTTEKTFYARARELYAYFDDLEHSPAIAAAAAASMPGLR